MDPIKKAHQMMVEYANKGNGTIDDPGDSPEERATIKKWGEKKLSECDDCGSVSLFDRTEGDADIYKCIKCGTERQVCA